MVRASPAPADAPCDRLTVALQQAQGQVFEFGRRRRTRGGLLESAHRLAGVGLRPIPRPSISRARLEGPPEGLDFARTGAGPNMPVRMVFLTSERRC